VHIGFSTGNYTQSTDVGNTAEAMIPMPLSGSTYFFVVGAYNAAKVEGPFSDEVSIKAP
jgi:hypothetical protein